MLIWIYKLIKKDATNDDMVYIGSTEDIDERMSMHKYRCYDFNSHKSNYKVYKYIRDNGGWDEWTYEIIDEIEVPLKKCEQRDKYEDEYIKKYDAINKLNSNYNCRSKKEYNHDNREKINERQRKYIYDNREKISEIKRQKISCKICGSIITKSAYSNHQRSKKCINFKNLSI